jgi:hypothetical protein
VREFGKMFGSRQVSRMGLVGCTNPQLVHRQKAGAADYRCLKNWRHKKMTITFWATFKNALVTIIRQFFL